jgi:hypothetical protein
MRVKVRKRYRVLVLAAIVAAVVVPVGYALSIEPQPIANYARAGLGSTAPSASLVASSVVVRTTSSSSRSPIADPVLRPVPDSVKLLLVGTVLFGLAAMLRKAV